jgi:microsomal epoxide hydrolase
MQLRAMGASLRPTVACALLIALFTGAPVALSSERDPFASAFAKTADGVNLHYLHGGRATSHPTVVFVPGWTWSASVWSEQMLALANSREVVAIDPRSQGESTKVVNGNTPEDRAEDLHKLLLHLNEAPVVLVGWSQGVQDIAAYVELHGTERIAGLVLVDSAFSAGPASFDVDPTGTRQLLHRISIYAHYPTEYLAGMIDASLVQPMSADKKSELARAAANTPTDTGIAMLVSDVLTTDRRGVVKKINRPTLIVAASSSGELEALGKMARDIPGARLRVIPGAGHAVFVDQPTQFSQVLGRFLDDLTDPEQK